MVTRSEQMQASILAVLDRHSSPRSAYDMIGELRGDNPKLAPATVYRALAVLIENGRVHHVESLNAYVACQCEQHDHASILAICNECGVVEENVTTDCLGLVTALANQTGFATTRHVIELHGQCSSCKV